jgi:hypothetical protein
MNWQKTLIIRRIGGIGVRLKENIDKILNLTDLGGSRRTWRISG